MRTRPRSGQWIDKARYRRFTCSIPQVRGARGCRLHSLASIVPLPCPRTHTSRPGGVPQKGWFTRVTRVEYMTSYAKKEQDASLGLSVCGSLSCAEHPVRSGARVHTQWLPISDIPHLSSPLHLCFPHICWSSEPVAVLVLSVRRRAVRPPARRHGSRPRGWEPGQRAPVWRLRKRGRAG